MMDIHPPGTEFKIGKSIVVKKGEDLTIVATGETLQRAYLASEILKESNINYIEAHSLKEAATKAVEALKKIEVK